MVLKETKLTTADNSGAKSIYCIFCIANTKKNKLGKFVKVTLKNFVNRRKVLEKKKKYLGLIVNTTQPKQRKNGVNVKFSKNRALLFHENGTKFLGSRIYGPTCKELRSDFLKFKKIIVMSQTLV